MTATDLYASRREGAARAREDPGAPGTGKGWSRGCSAEEGSLKTHTHTKHVTQKNIIQERLLQLSHDDIRTLFGANEEPWLLTLQENRRLL